MSVKYSGNTTKCSIKSTIKNCMQGKRVFTTSSGYRYIGSFKENNREGQGTMNYPAGEQYGEGSQYNGYWKLNKRNG
jgi:hypothetical protein